MTPGQRRASAARDVARAAVCSTPVQGLAFVRVSARPDGRRAFTFEQARCHPETGWPYVARFTATPALADLEACHDDYPAACALAAEMIEALLMVRLPHRKATPAEIAQARSFLVNFTLPTPEA